MDKTPYIDFRYDQLVKNYEQFRNLMPRVDIAYAVKSNSHADVIKTLSMHGSGFDVASLQEVHHVRACGIASSNAPLYYSNPIRTSNDIYQAFRLYGARYFVVDSLDGVLLLDDLPVNIKKDAKFYIRLYVKNEQSVQQLSLKFGADINEIDKIVGAAEKYKINIAGVSFHVGSQCLVPEAFCLPMQMAKYVLSVIKEHNPREQRLLLNIGGGFPATDNPDSSLEKFAEVINRELKHFNDTIDVIAEPGRGMVANAGTLYTKVLLIKSLNTSKTPIAYLDAGVYQGLIEMKQGMKFTFNSDRKGDLISWVVAGPTCDSFDMLGEFQLPKNLQVGDILTMHNAGAYVRECGTYFNGFMPPDHV